MMPIIMNFKSDGTCIREHIFKRLNLTQMPYLFSMIFQPPQSFYWLDYITVCKGSKNILEYPSAISIVIISYAIVNLNHYDHP